MPTVKLVDENTKDPRVKAVFDDIKATRKTERINNFWRALATNPQHLESVWRHLKTVMKPGRLDALTKEMIAVAVSSTNGCAYCVNSHIAAAQKLGMDTETLGELMAVVGLFNMTNKLVFGYQVDPDVLPQT
ncbi:MAG: carboxymuconolactone decarboxylase family protein [Gemmataceae bacterium]